MNVLFLAHRLPYAPNRGDRVRAFHLLRHMSPWASVDLLALAHDADEASHAGELNDLVRSVTTVRVPRIRNMIRSALALPSSTPTTHTMLGAPGLDAAVLRLVSERKPDVIFCYCTGVAPPIFLPQLRAIPVVLDMVDVDSEKWASLAAGSPPPWSWLYGREARVLRVFEAEAARRAVTTLVVTDRERDSLAAIAPDASVATVSNGVDLDSLRSREPPAADPVAVFCGVMNYAPNVEGAVWLVRNVWPLVRRGCPGARLEIVGSHPTRAVRALANAETCVTVTGAVPDVRLYLWHAAASVAPLQTARGVQNKVLEAVAAGLNVVTTPVVQRGLPREVLGACTAAETPAAFAEAILSLFARTPEDRCAQATSVNLSTLSWAECLRPVQTILSEASRRGRGSEPMTQE